MRQIGKLGFEAIPMKLFIKITTADDLKAFKDSSHQKFILKLVKSMDFEHL